LITVLLLLLLLLLALLAGTLADMPGTGTLPWLLQ
jgi:hypothetical protein